MATRDFRSRLQRRAAKAKVLLPGDLPDRLAAYYELLARWNRKINLTALENVDDAIDRLLLEPVVAARYLPSPAARVLDVGSGGGSPAIPLKLAASDISMRMVESKARKSAFLREAVRQLGLTETRVETARYEELLAVPELHEAADVLTLRAVRVEPRVLTTLQAFLGVGGSMLLFRGQAGPEEIHTVPPLEWTATVPLLDLTRSRLSLLVKRPVGGVASRMAIL